MFRRTPKHIIDRLYTHLDILDKFFTKHKIMYWAVGGTLLGAIRGGGIIPWDDDCDIGISVNDLAFVFDELSPVAAENGISIWNTEHGLKFFDKIATPEGRATTDIFVYTDEDIISKWVLSSSISRKAWPKDYFACPMQIERKNIGHLSINIPSDYMKYLIRLYGEDCMTHAYLDFDHLQNKKHENANKKYLLADA